mmetsp:Transcript_15356/g.58440  ORF Transcript_15356/g.58440 Transcript_15356/m.58440 type:complete len:230 (-) Transcript_15356:1761-2450(-)
MPCAPYSVVATRKRMDPSCEVAEARFHPSSPCCRGVRALSAPLGAFGVCPSVRSWKNSLPQLSSSSASRESIASFPLDSLFAMGMILLPLLESLSRKMHLQISACKSHPSAACSRPLLSRCSAAHLPKVNVVGSISAGSDAVEEVSFSVFCSSSSSLTSTSATGFRGVNTPDLLRIPCASLVIVWRMPGNKDCCTTGRTLSTTSRSVDSETPILSSKAGKTMLCASCCM